MKKTIRYSLILIAALALLLTPVMFTSCASTDGTTTQAAATFRTFQDTWDVALAAYDIYCERVAMNKVSAEGQLKADAAWNLFRSTFKQAFIQASANNMSDPAPAQVQNDVRNIASTLSGVR